MNILAKTGLILATLCTVFAAIVAGKLIVEVLF